MATKCNDSKRRDHKGRILKTGESQRADLIYQYRFTDIRGKRHCIDSGMNPKNVQYLMGHVSIHVTMNAYAHSNDHKAAEDFFHTFCHFV